MKKRNGIYFIIIASIALMIYNISQLDFDVSPKGPLAGIISNLFLILAMIITLRDLNKKEKE